MTLTVTCPTCGGKHDLAMDAAGHYAGRLPCDATRRIEVQVNPDEWRALVAEEEAKRVH